MAWDINEALKNPKIAAQLGDKEVEAIKNAQPAVAAAGTGKVDTSLEDQFLADWTMLCRSRPGLYTEPERQVSLKEEAVAVFPSSNWMHRNWKFDFCFSERVPSPLLVEIQGGAWRAKGAHNTGKALHRDCIKLNAAQMLGYTVFKFATNHVTDGTAVAITAQWFDQFR